MENKQEECILDIFCTIFDSSCILKHKSYSDAILSENGKEAKLKKIYIKDIKENNVVILHTDKSGLNEEGHKISNLFSIQKYGHNKSCDYVLIKKISEQEFEIYYIDLKSDKPTGFENQFKSTKCFINYIKSLIEIFSSKKIVFTKERFILFTTLKPRNTTNIFNKNNIEMGREISNPRKIPVTNKQEILYSRLINCYDMSI